MRYFSMSVVLVIIGLTLGLGCSAGNNPETGIPIFDLPPNQNQDGSGNQPTGPILDAIAITPGSSNVEIGGKQIFKAYGHYTDNAVIDITGTVTWFSTNMSVGVIDDKGVFTASNIGWAGIGAYTTSSGNLPQFVYSPYSFANVFSAGVKPPDPVRNVKVAQIGDKAEIAWDFSTAPNIKGYNVYSSRISGVGYDKDNPINEDLIILSHFEDINPGDGVIYYVVAAVTTDDIIGAFSQEAELDFDPEPPWFDSQP